MPLSVHINMAAWFAQLNEVIHLMHSLRHGFVLWLYNNMIIAIIIAIYRCLLLWQRRIALCQYGILPCHIISGTFTLSLDWVLDGLRRHPMQLLLQFYIHSAFRYSWHHAWPIYTVFHKIGTPLYFFNNIFKCWSISMKITSLYSLGNLWFAIL